RVAGRLRPHRKDSVSPADGGKVRAVRRIVLHPPGGRDIRLPLSSLVTLEATVGQGGVMRPVLLLSACLGCLVSGCGTVVNLLDGPPRGPGDSRPPNSAEGSLFGGVRRSAGLGVVGLAGGLLSIPSNGLAPETLGVAAEMTTVGLVALLDTP